MIYPGLYFTDQVWRSPYKTNSKLLQLTSRCTWHKCKFCSLYHDTPFRMSPLSEVEENLYLPQMVSFGTFARVTDITPKSAEELKNLHHLKLDSINIGIETVHAPTLERMNKGYRAADILEQLSKLDEAGIRYNVFYLNELGAKGDGETSAIATAEVLNKLHPCIINILTHYKKFCITSTSITLRI